MTFTNRLFLAVLLVLAATAMFGQDATPPANPTGLNFNASSGAVAFRYQGEFSVATKLTQSMDVYDWGAAKTNHLSIGAYELLAPTPAVNFYGPGARIDPDLTKVMSKLNVKADSFGVFAEGAVGGATYGSPQKTSVGVYLGAGAKYKLANSLSWNAVEIGYWRLGSTNAMTCSTSLKYFFTH